MCDSTPIRNWLLALLAAIWVAVSLIVAAAATNGSFWLAWQSPGWMGAAAVATAGAGLLCGGALTALEAFCRCAPRCAGSCSSLRGSLTATRAVLGIQATACLGAALIAWIPIGGQVPMYIILGALLAQVFLIVSAFAFLSQLAACNAPAPTGTGSGGLGGPATRPPLNV